MITFPEFCDKIRANPRFAIFLLAVGGISECVVEYLLSC